MAAFDNFREPKKLRKNKANGKCPCFDPNAVSTLPRGAKIEPVRPPNRDEKSHKY